MTARARRSNARTAHDDLYPEFLAGERIGPAPARRGGRMLRGIVVLIALGAGWAVLSGQVAWPAWLPTDMAALWSSIDRRGPAPVAPASPRTVEPLPSADIEPSRRLAAPDPPPSPAVAPSTETQAARAPLTTGALPPVAKRLDDAPAQPLPPANPDPADPYQTRAAAVGLHPDLSRALLARLSPTDFRNAGTAIKTALAETAETAVYVWPRQRKPEEALFKVRFVPGAASGCRRYVVTVTKDGWLTTALPMEKCGPQPRQARRE